MAYGWVYTLNDQELASVMDQILGLASEHIGKKGWSPVKSSDSGVAVETAVARSAHLVLKDKTGHADIPRVAEECFAMIAFISILEARFEEVDLTTWDAIRANIQEWQSMPKVNGFATMYIIECARGIHSPWRDIYDRVQEMAPTDFYPWAVI